MAARGREQPPWLREGESSRHGCAKREQPGAAAMAARSESARGRQKSGREARAPEAGESGREARAPEAAMAARSESARGRQGGAAKRERQFCTTPSIGNPPGNPPPPLTTPTLGAGMGASPE